MSNKKAIKAISSYIERILVEYTDKEHTLSVTDICRKLRQLYGIDKSDDYVRECLDALDQFYKTDAAYKVMHTENYKDNEITIGIEAPEQISIHPNYVMHCNQSGNGRNSKKRYYVTHSRIHKRELRHMISLLCDTSATSSSKAFIQKLVADRSYAERKELTRHIDTSEDKTSEAQLLEQVLSSVEFINDVIDTADQKRELLSFRYLSHKTMNDHRTTLARPSLKETIETTYVDMVPYWVAFEDGFYYLYCKKLGYTDKVFVVIRIDRIKPGTLQKAQLKDKRRWPKAYSERQHQAQEQARASVQRIPDERIIHVTLRCHDNNEKKYIIESFSNKREFAMTSANEFSFYVSFDGMKYWALKHVRSCEVVSPKNLRRAIIDKIEHNHYGIAAAQSESELCGKEKYARNARKIYL